ncbi:hypothetical protein Tco_0895261 [Tanacetum coccineum]|uniref:Reverse transcriptase domain-containing protein n=1 Tax=Tanacetum coccineum TaxID=301880 RepID=A0ABQ5CFB3_9ASTR
MFSAAGDGVTSSTRRRHNPPRDGVTTFHDRVSSKACHVSLGAEVGVFRRWNGGQNGCIWKPKRGLKRVGLGVEVGAEMVGEWNEMTMRLFLAVTKLPPMQTDDEPMWVADHVVAPTPGSAITIPETANEFAIKGNHLTLVKGNQFDGRTKTDPHKHIHEFLGICDMFKYRDTENEAVRLMMFPLSLTGEEKTWLDELNEGTIETWDELRTFDRLADKQSGRPSGSLPSNTQPNPKGHNSKAYQPPQSRNEHVNAVLTRSGKSYNPPVNPND